MTIMMMKRCIFNHMWMLIILMARMMTTMKNMLTAVFDQQIFIEQDFSTIAVHGGTDRSDDAATNGRRGIGPK